MDIIMPKMGESVTEGTIIKWHKSVGDFVKLDEIIFEISTDKVDTEIPAVSNGIISEIIVNEGETVEVGTIVGRIDSEMDNQVSSKSEKESVSLVDNKVEIKNEKIESVNPTANTSENLLKIVMPKMGESVMEGTIIKWFKKVGDKVKRDETIFEISTDKVDTEIPSPEDGVLAEILVGEQETVEVGTIVAKLSVGSNVKIKDQNSFKDELQVELIPSQTDSLIKNTSVHSTGTKVKSNNPGSGFYSPLVLSIAQKENVSFDELNSISGTGLDGRITKKDVLAYLEHRKSQPARKYPAKDQSVSRIHTENKSAMPAPGFVPYSTQVGGNLSDVEEIPMDNIRQKIMDHMVHSRDTSVHVTGLTEVDMTRIHNFINNKKDDLLKNENVKLTYMAFIADAVIKALKKYPLVNSSITENKILQKKFINLGIAVAIEPNGLIVPNIKSAGDRNIIGLARAIADLAERARTKKLTPDDISNGTFSITNYGVFGTIFGTPIINQPEVAILGVGVVQKKPVVIEVDGTDTIAIRRIMALTLSHDHRLVDGMLGGLFLKYVRETLENFEGVL